VHFDDGKSVMNYGQYWRHGQTIFSAGPAVVKIEI